MITPQTALIYTMVLCSAADGVMTDAELASMGDMVEHLPVFSRYDRANIERDGAACVELLKKEDGLDRALDLIDQALPVGLRETAYALACDVVAADATASQEELQYLELVRHRLKVDRLVAAAIERGARARHQTH